MADQPSTVVGGVHYNVTLRYVLDAAADTRQTAAQIQEQLQALRGYVENLEASWGGIAHNQFVHLMARYHHYAEMLHHSLMGISNGLHGTHVNYSTTEHQAVTNVNAVGDELQAPAAGTNFH